MEPATFDLALYKAALIVLGAAAVVIPLFHRLRVSSVLGFMLVGIVVGPFGLASLATSIPWLSAISISEPETIDPIAHLGVVLLLFMIGLELSFERLVVMRRLVWRGAVEPFIMELPAYKTPDAKNVLMNVLLRAKIFLRRIFRQNPKRTQTRFAQARSFAVSWAQP